MDIVDYLLLLVTVTGPSPFSFIGLALSNVQPLMQIYNCLHKKVRNENVVICRPRHGVSRRLTTRFNGTAIAFVNLCINSELVSLSRSVEIKIHL